MNYNYNNHNNRRNGSFGWSEFIIGVILLVIGILTFAQPEGALTGVIIAYGAVVILMGVDDILVYIRLARFTGFGSMLSLFSGIMSVMCGVMIIANPRVGKWALAVLLPVWFIAHCITGLTHTGFIRLIGNPFYYYFSLILNIIGLILGIMMLMNPILSFLTIRTTTYMAALYMILFGVESIVGAFARRHSDW